MPPCLQLVDVRAGSFGEIIIVGFGQHIGKFCRKQVLLCQIGKGAVRTFPAESLFDNGIGKKAVFVTQFVVDQLAQVAAQFIIRNVQYTDGGFLDAVQALLYQAGQGLHGVGIHCYSLIKWQLRVAQT